MLDPLAQLTTFGRRLREDGLSVGPDRIAAFCRAAALLSRGDLYWAGHATLVSRPEQLPAYDRAFLAFFGVAPVPVAPRPRLAEVVEETEVAVGLSSRDELLRDKDFGSCTPEELDQLSSLLTRLPSLAPPKRLRRRQPGRVGSLDLRRTLRRVARTAGEPLVPVLRERRQRPRRLVLLLDVSGSMKDYIRPLLLFAHVMLRRQHDGETFCFGTRLTRLTRTLSHCEPKMVLARAADCAGDWQAGTRIGESLQAFLDGFGHRGLARGAVVVICSDGLDVGDPRLLAEQMERLSRLAYRTVWLNPLKSHQDYEPLARGMQAALPHIDVFDSGHSLASLEQVAERIATAAAA